LETIEMAQSPLPAPKSPQHPRFDRRFALQAGAIGLLGLGMNHLAALRAASAAGSGGRAALGQPRP